MPLRRGSERLGRRSSGSTILDDVFDTLTTLPIFKCCDADLLMEIARQAESVIQEPTLGDDSPLQIIVSGATQVSVGYGPAATHSVGSVFNTAGLLNLSEPLKPYDAKPHINLNEFADVEDPRKKELSLEELVCARCHIPSPQTHLFKIEIMDANTEHAVRQRVGQKRISLLRSDPEAGQGALAGFAFVANIEIDVILQVFAGTPSAYQFRQNINLLKDVFRAISCHKTFPGVPPEVLWQLAEVSELEDFAAGDLLAVEGDCRGCEALCLVDTGEALVEKLTYLGGRDAEPVVIGVLGPGALVGNICLLGSRVPNPTTVRAQTAMRVIKIPSRGFCDVLVKYPGMSASFKDHLKDMNVLLKIGLPRPAEAFASLKMFANCGQAFIRALAGISARKIVFAGDVVRDEGESDPALRLIEFGVLQIEKNNEHRVLGFTPTGTVLGERAFFGLANVSFSRLRCHTPVAHLVYIPQGKFHALLESHPNEMHRFQNLMTDGGSVKRDNDIMSLSIFQESGAKFIKTMGNSIVPLTFVPGQTMTVQQAMDSGAMYIIKGGQAGVIIDGVRRKTITNGDSFGELALLGIVKRRAATVRAETICFCLEVPRAAFLKALELHPEEKDHFASLSTQHLGEASKFTWPNLPGVPGRLLYYVNLYSERHITAQGQWTSYTGEQLRSDAAFMVVKGAVTIVSDSGEEDDVISEGKCFGEQILMGLPVPAGRLVPQEACEVQIISQEVFDRIVGDCPDWKDRICTHLVDGMAKRAVERLGILNGSTALGLSAIFRAASENFVIDMQCRVNTRIVLAGDLIIERGEPGDSMVVLVQGSAIIEAKQDVLKESGPDIKIFAKPLGELNLLGVACTYPMGVRATGPCLIQTISRPNMLEVLQHFPAEMKLFEDFKNEHTLQKKEVNFKEQLKQNQLLSKTSPQFIAMACLQAEDLIFAPGDEIIRKGEQCKLGKTSMYVMLAGEVEIEEAFGEVLGTLKPGDVIGEGGALGLTKKRSAGNRASSHGMVHLIKLQGISIKMAVQRFPDQYQVLSSTFMKRAALSEDFRTRRQAWLQDIVIPALQKLHVFHGIEKDFLVEIADPLLKITYNCGEKIVSLGEQADSLIILLEGEAEIISKQGLCVERITDGAAIGETAVLGILNQRTATVRATLDSNVVAVESSFLWDLLGKEEWASTRQLFLKRISARREQVDSGLPICQLPVGLQIQDCVTRFLALHAEKCEMAQGIPFLFPSDHESYGDMLLILNCGQAVVVLGPSSDVIAKLTPGQDGLVLEGLLRKFDAQIIAAKKRSELFRLRRSHILLAAQSVQTDSLWFCRFEAFEKDVSRRLQSRLTSGTALITERCRLKEKSLAVREYANNPKDDEHSLVSQFAGHHFTKSVRHGLASINQSVRRRNRMLAWDSKLSSHSCSALSTLNANDKQPDKGTDGAKRRSPLERPRSENRFRRSRI